MILIDGTPTEATHFAYDGCHKIYLLTSAADVFRMFDAGWEGEDMYPISELPEIWEETCPLRFISNADLTMVIDQGDDALIWEE